MFTHYVLLRSLRTYIRGSPWITSDVSSKFLTPSHPLVRTNIQVFETKHTNDILGKSESNISLRLSVKKSFFKEFHGSWRICAIPFYFWKHTLVFILLFSKFIYIAVFSIYSCVNKHNKLEHQIFLCTNSGFSFRTTCENPFFRDYKVNLIKINKVG